MRSAVLKTLQRGNAARQNTNISQQYGHLLQQDAKEVMENKSKRYLSSSHSIAQSLIGLGDWTNINKYFKSCERFSNITQLSRLENWIDQFNKDIPGDPVTRIETDSKVYVVGDVHGDINKLLDSLHLAGLIEDQEGEVVWTGGSSIVVQLGDLLDRGDDDIAAILMLRYINTLASRDGGAIYSLNGNHEVLNGNQRYDTVSLESFRKACRMMEMPVPDDEIELYRQGARARSALFQPGKLLSQELSRNPTVLVINDIIFAHGGVLPKHCDDGFENINSQVNQWYMGELVDDMQKKNPFLSRPIATLRGDSSIVWNRTYSQEKYTDEKYDEAFQLIQQVLHKENASCHIVAHTPQPQGINRNLGGLVWRVDIGMCGKVLDSDPQVLQIDWKNGTKNPTFAMLK